MQVRTDTHAVIRRALAPRYLRPAVMRARDEPLSHILTPPRSSEIAEQCSVHAACYAAS